jgi:hypothetical protein
VNAVARKLNGGGSWVGGGPCLVNAVARKVSQGKNVTVDVSSGSKCYS